MSVPAGQQPSARAGGRPPAASPQQRPAPQQARPAPQQAGPAAPPQHVTQLRESLAHVLSGLRFPARRWEVIAEADSWGVGGPVRQVIGRLPDGNYPSLAVVIDVLTGPAGRPAPDPGHAGGRVVVPMRAPANGPRRTH